MYLINTYWKIERIMVLAAGGEGEGYDEGSDSRQGGRSVAHTGAERAVRL